MLFQEIAERPPFIDVAGHPLQLENQDHFNSARLNLPHERSQAGPVHRTAGKRGVGEMPHFDPAQPTVLADMVPANGELAFARIESSSDLVVGGNPGVNCDRNNRPRRAGGLRVSVHQFRLGSKSARR